MIISYIVVFSKILFNFYYYKNLKIFENYKRGWMYIKQIIKKIFFTIVIKYAGNHSTFI